MGEMLLTRWIAQAFAIFFVIAAGTSTSAQDCNGNGEPDALDIDSGESADCNENLSPDECDTAPLEFDSHGPRLTFEGTGIQSLVSGDINGDEVADLIVSHGAAFSVLLGRKDRALSVSSSDEIAERIAGLVLADIDGDNDLDLAAAGGAAVHAFRNVGEARFESAGVFATPSNVNSVSAADVTGDGRVDLLTTGFRPGQAQFSVLVNQGEGTFAEPVSWETGRRSDNLAVGDVDGDGDLDVVVPEQRTQILQFFINDGSGNFTPADPLPLDAVPGRIHGGDFDGDGALDLVVHFFGINETHVFMRPFLARGGGGFTSVKLATDTTSGVVVADLDADHDLDIVTATREAAPVVVVHQNNGAGAFVPTPQGVVEATHLTAADYDGDGGIDLAAAHGADLRVLWSSRRGRLTLSGQTFEATLPHGIALLDFDRDGDQDVALPSGFQGIVTILHNDGSGQLDVGTTFGFPKRLESLSAGDVDNDGNVDLISSERETGSIVLFRNTGNQQLVCELYPSGLNTRMATFADMDGNGFLDLLGANLDADSVTIIFNEDGHTFERSQTLQVGQRPWSVLAADFDGDGDNDLATSNGASFDVSVIVNEGEEGFAPESRHPASGSLQFIVGGDFDHDGDIDLAAAGGQHRVASVLLNHGDATFAAAVDYPLEGSPYSMLTTDLDGDGHLDLVSANETDNTASVVLGQGNGAFSPPLIFPAGEGLRFTAAGDMDGDGDVDLVTANRVSQDVTVLTNLRINAGDSRTHLEAICTPLDFHGFSVPEGGETASRSLKFLAPARSDPTLLPPLFPHSGRFPQLREFLMTVFPERYATVDATQYATLVAQRATRDYFAGSIARHEVDGQVVYGFDLLVDESPAEALTLEEVRRVFAVLEAAFTLPGLAYLPRAAAARKVADGWKDPRFPVVIIDDSTPPPMNEPPLEGTPTFTLEIPEGLVICGTFATGGADRGPAEEYALKSQVRFRGGRIDLPTTDETFAVELFDEVRFGPSREVAQPVGEGKFRILGIPGPERSTVYRFTYDKEYVLDDGGALRLSWVRPIQLRALGEEKLDEKLVLTEDFFVVEVGTEALQASLNGVRLVRYGSCSYSTLPRFDVRVELSDGSRLRFDERFLEQKSLLATGPASLLQAEVESGGATRVIDDYWRLVYSALKHNTQVRYRVILDPALRIEDAGEVRAVEILLADPPEAQVEATYLGNDFEVVRTLEGTYEKMAVRSTARFLRGDSGGDGALDVTDALALLRYIFQREALACVKAADTNDDARVNVIDAVRVIGQLFGRIELLPPPFPECGEDATEDGLRCEAPPPCAS